MVQGIAIREQPAKILFMKKVFHEMIHFKSYNALQVTSGDRPELDEYRVGLAVHTRNGEIKYFVNLNEAVTEELAKRFSGKLLNNPLFTEEIEKTRKVITKYPQAITDSGEPLFDTDTLYAEVNGKKSWGESVGRLFGAQEKAKRITTGGFVYQQERKILNTLIDKIFKRNPEKFREKKEVFEVFAKGIMTGNILPVGKLIEKTFGRGTLRLIGDLDTDINAQEDFIGSL
jgi:hypothetical protein